MSDLYIKPRDFIVCGQVGVCALTKAKCVEQIFMLPVEPVSATVDLIGIPAVVAAYENENLRRVFNMASMAIIDGMPVVKIGRKLGFQCERCSGPDIMALIFEESVKQKKTHYFYGGKSEEVLKRLKENLEFRYPEIQILGMKSPPFRSLSEDEDSMICKEINELKPDFLWVGLGLPKQELWMYEHRGRIAGTIMLGVGAAFDFEAGTLKNAPDWITNAGFAWLYRMMQEPQRLWRRYIYGGVKYLYLSAKYKSKILE